MIVEEGIQKNSKLPIKHFSQQKQKTTKTTTTVQLSYFYTYSNTKITKPIESYHSNLYTIWYCTN